MSSRTLPLLFINLGGEMLYILDQRLRAQNIPADKAKKVMNDIITTMFNKKFLEELFKPQEPYSKKALRTVFDRLAHASIMRLNQASMDKLYDLMTMAFKYQVLLCPRPRDLLLVSFNHMDAIKEFVKDTACILAQVDETYRQLIEMYTPLAGGEFQLIRQTLLIFFQDMHIRVSIFLKDKVQNSNGRFALPISGPVPHGTQIPSWIRMYSCTGQEMSGLQFNNGGNYTAALCQGSFELFGDRVTKLGTNMYSVCRPVETHMSGTSKRSAQHTKVNLVPNPLAKEELNLLAKLMGGLEVPKAGSAESGFRVNLFATDEEEEWGSVAVQAGRTVIRIHKHPSYKGPNRQRRAGQDHGGIRPVSGVARQCRQQRGRPAGHDGRPVTPSDPSLSDPPFSSRRWDFVSFGHASRSGHDAESVSASRFCV